MYLSRIKLDRNDPGVRQCLRNCQDMHRSIMKMFNTDRKSAGVLFRLSLENMTIYMLSCVEPKQCVPGMTITGTKDITDFERCISSDDVFDFDILLSPSKKVKEQDVKNSRRRFLRTAEERVQWMERKAEQNGFSIINCQEQKYLTMFCKHSSENDGKMLCNTMRYTGTLTLTDKDKFVSAFKSGIGSEKAYGLGMLLLRNKR